MPQGFKCVERVEVREQLCEWRRERLIKWQLEVHFNGEAADGFSGNFPSPVFLPFFSFVLSIPAPPSFIVFPSFPSFSASLCDSQSLSQVNRLILQLWSESLSKRPRAPLCLLRKQLSSPNAFHLVLSFAAWQSSAIHCCWHISCRSCELVFCVDFTELWLIRCAGEWILKLFYLFVL